VLPGNGKGKIVHWEHGKSDAEIADVLAGKRKLYFLAVISYRDGDKRWYATGICNVLDIPTMGLSVAGGPDHNFMT
jgi:hypothetical protein